MSIEYTSSQCESIVSNLRAKFNSGKTKSLEFRRQNILGVKKFLIEKENEICQAVKIDLGRAKYEAIIFEIAPLLSDLETLLKDLPTHMKPKLVPTPMAMLPATSYIESIPYGVSLIIAPFNYPIQIALWPLIGAIAAGNVAVLKPSELTPNCAKLLENELPKYIDAECFQVVNGAVETTKALLAQRWDKIFFTGSPRVGKIVMKAAAEHLTSVTLELGGKSPTIVDQSVSDLSLAANRIVWGKIANAGQTCIAPDYVLCHTKVFDQFLQALNLTSSTFFNGDASKSLDFGRIVSVNYAERLDKMIKNENPGNIVFGGVSDVANRYIPPTVIKNVHFDSPLLQEEIFGPILPVIPYTTADDVINAVRKIGENPLALYIFARDKELIDKLKENIASGGCVINDTIFQAANCHLPFGGKGNSGIGAYHGDYTFKCFSHERGVIDRDDHKFLDVSVRYPPYDQAGIAKTLFLTRLPSLSPHFIQWTLLFSAILVGIAVGVGLPISRKY